MTNSEKNLSISTESNSHKISIQSKITNTSDENYIVIVEPALKLCLKENFEFMKDSKDWLTPFWIFITIIITFLTADFNKTFLGLNWDNWKWVFVIFLILSWVFFLLGLYKLFKNKTTLDDLMDKIKNINEVNKN